MARVAARATDVCEVDQEALASMRARYTSDSTPGNTFSKCISELGCCKRRVTKGKTRVCVWCLKCRHTEEAAQTTPSDTSTSGAKKRASDPSGNERKRHSGGPRAPSTMRTLEYPDDSSQTTTLPPPTLPPPKTPQLPLLFFTGR